MWGDAVLAEKYIVFSVESWKWGFEGCRMLLGWLFSYIMRSANLWSSNLARGLHPGEMGHCSTINYTWAGSTLTVQFSAVLELLTAMNRSERMTGIKRLRHYTSLHNMGKTERAFQDQVDCWLGANWSFCRSSMEPDLWLSKILCWSQDRGPGRRLWRTMQSRLICE